MLSSFAVLALVAIFSTGINAIFNGIDTDIKDAPFAVMIHDSSDLGAFTGLVCGGTIIGKRYILTAAHCLGQYISDYEMEYDYKWLRVVAGVTSYECGVNTYEILNAYVHPDFNEVLHNEEVIRADLAVLKLKERLTFGPTIKRIRLAINPPQTNSPGIIYGWGDTLPDEPSFSRILQSSVQTVYDYQTCRRMDPDTGYHKDELCVKGNQGFSLGPGDSGSPLVVNQKLVGVISRGLEDGTDEPGAVSNVAYYRTWIDNAVRGTAQYRTLPYTVSTPDSSQGDCDK